MAKYRKQNKIGLKLAKTVLGHPMQGI